MDGFPKKSKFFLEQFLKKIHFSSLQHSLQVFDWKTSIPKMLKISMIILAKKLYSLKSPITGESVSGSILFLDQYLSSLYSSKQELKAWYKGFKRDCPKAQLSRGKVFTLISPPLFLAPQRVAYTGDAYNPFPLPAFEHLIYIERRLSQFNYKMRLQLSTQPFLFSCPLTAQ